MRSGATADPAGADPPCAHELNPVEQVWSYLNRSLVNVLNRLSATTLSPRCNY